MTEATNPRRNPTLWVVTGGMLVLVILAVVGLFMVRGYFEAQRYREAVQACMEYRGLDTFDPDGDGLDHANQAAECGDIAQRNS